MGLLTLLLLAVVGLTIKYLMKSERTESDSNLIRSVGLFALVFGILGQLIGLYDAFNTIAQVGSVSPKILYAGFKVSMITTMYGLVIYALSLLIWLGLRLKG